MILQKYFPDFKILTEHRYKNSELGKIYVNARNKHMAEESDKSGLLVCKIQKGE